MFSKLFSCCTKPKTSEPTDVSTVKAQDYKIPVHFSPYHEEPKTTPYPKRKRVQTYGDEDDMTITYLPPTTVQTQTQTEMPSIPGQSPIIDVPTDKYVPLTLRELAPLNLIPLEQTHPTDMEYTFIAPIVPPKISDATVAHRENALPEGGTELYRLDMNGTELRRTNTTTADADMTRTELYRTDTVPDSDMELNRPYVTSDKKPDFDESTTDSDKLASASLSFASPYITPGQVSLRKVFSGTRYDDFYGPISRV